MVVPYSTIPHFPTPTVEGHQGNVVAGSVGDAPLPGLPGPVSLLRGPQPRCGDVSGPGHAAAWRANPDPDRRHGRDRSRHSVPARSFASKITSTCSARIPARAQRRAIGCPASPTCPEVYSRRLWALAFEEASQLGLDLASGVYACLPGPSYETPAEIRMLRTLGADVVGMSTVPEAIVARHSGLEVLALATVTNAAAGLSGELISHDEVVEAGRKATPLIGALIERITQRLNAEGH